MPLYDLTSGKAIQIKPTSFSKEKDLQSWFEANLDALLGVQFIASEFSTGDRHRGRIDTLGLDQDGSPVLIEYKKSGKETIINQGLFYLDWLVDHKGDFTLEAQKKLGKDIEIDWSRPRLILIAEYFSEYDKLAVNRIGANMELWVFKKYSNNMLYLDPIYVADTPREKGKKADRGDKGKKEGTVWIQNSQLKLWLDIPISELEDSFNIAKDVSNIGHWGTGEVEVNLENESQLDQVMALVEQAFRQTI